MLLAGPRPRRAAAASLALLLLTVTGSALPAGAADPRFERQRDDPIAVARRQRDTLQQRIAAQTDHLATLREASGRLSRQVDHTTSRLDDVMTDLTALRSEVEEVRAQLETAEGRRDELKDQVTLLDWSLEQLAEAADELATDLATRRRALGARLAEAYRSGNVGLWEQVISADSLADVVVEQEGLLGYAQRDLEMAQEIARDQSALDRRRRDIRQLRWETDTLRTSVTKIAEGIAVDRDRLLVVEAELMDREAVMEALRVEQEEELERLAGTREEVAALLVEQRAAAERLGGRITTLLQKERRSGRLPSAFNRTFRWPLRGHISQEFGCTGFVLEPARDGCEHFHGGIDIVSTMGAPIVAPADGIILFAGWDPDEKRKEAPWQVIIAHSDRLVSLYGHLKAGRPSGIYTGARVREGQVIGWMGNTGNSTGAHLHWSVILNGEPVNPRYFL